MSYPQNPGYPPGTPGTPGAPGSFAPGPYGAPPPQGNGMAVAGLVCGLVGLALFWFVVVGWIVALLGIIFGALGIGRAKKVEGRGHGLAIAGLATGALGLILGIVFVAWIASEAEDQRRRMHKEWGSQLDAPETRSHRDAARSTPDHA